MTGRRVSYVCWLCLLAAGCIISTSPVFPALAALSLAAAALSALLTWRQASLVQLELTLSGAGHEAGETRQARGVLFSVYKGFLPQVTVETELRVRNCLTGDIQKAAVRQSLSKESPAAAELNFASRFCGRMEVSAETLQIIDPLGLAAFKRPCSLREALLILPEPVETDLIDELVHTPDLEGADFAEDRPGFDPSETFAIREYKEGDRLKNVHWKLSGKLDQLMVREPGLPVRSSSQLLMETCFPEEGGRRRSELIDRVCRYTVALSEQLIDAGASHQLGWMDYRENVFHNHEISGPDDLLDILPALLSAEVTFGRDNVKDKFFEEAAGQNVPGVIVIDDETIRQREY